MLSVKVISAIWGYDIQVISGIKDTGLGPLRILSKI